RSNRSNRKSTLSTLSIMLILAAIFVLFVIVFPKEPVHRAASTISGDGVEEYAMPSGEYEGLVISEIMASNNSAVPDSYGNYSDYIEVWNASDHAISLYNVGLSDRVYEVLFLFPNITLEANERIVVYASGYNDISSADSLHAKFKISSSKQETIALFDPSQFIVHQVPLPVLNANQVYALQEDGTFSVSDHYSPGFPNGEEGHVAYRASKTLTVGNLIINEIMADPLTGITDADGELGDWVEIYNPESTSQALKDVYLSDDPSKPFKWHFPEDAVIPANGYYVVFCTGKDRIDSATKVPHSNFRIKAEGETIVISDGMGSVVDMVSFDNMPRDTSYGLNEFGQFQYFEIATPGLENTPGSVAIMDEFLRAQNPTGVYISEVLASNTTIAIREEDTDFTDFAELYNSTDQTVNLSGYGLSDRISHPRKWQFPEGAVIAPGERKVLYLDKTNTFDGRDYHTNFKVSQHGGEVLTFSDPTGKILDKLHLPAIPSNYSYGRSDSREGFFYFHEPTPWAENATAVFDGFAKKPSFSIQGGLYDSKIELSFTVPENTTVYYTTNGDTPTQNDLLYDGQPIPVQYNTVFRARAFSSNPNIEPSGTITQSYFIGTAHTLPVVSLVGENVDIFDPQTGLLAVGVEIPAEDARQPFGKEYGALYATMGKIWRTGHVEVYTQENQQMVDQDISYALQGQFSLDHAQKSFKIKARAPLGTRYIDAPLFEDRAFTQYKGFVLRSGGNDTIWTRLVDGFQARLLDLLDTSVIRQAWNPVAVYLNGNYWGHYNMRERVDRYFVAQHEGLPLSQADDLVLLEGNGSVKYGSNKEYRELIKTVKTLSPGKNPEDLQYILDHIDIDSYFDYMAITMFLGDSDPGNIRYYKLNAEGEKWKWLLYDKDYGLYKSSFNSPYSYLKEKGMGQKNIDNTLIRKLLENEEMKDKFLTRLGEVYQILTTDTMLEILEPMVEILEPEMPLHFARWAEFRVKQIAFDNPTTPEGALRYWNERVERLRDTLRKRPNLFYDMVQEEFKLSDAQMLHYFGQQPPLPEGVQ
ncbi:MAG: hypothetical protein GX786_05680, partial [Clostridiales bacterium]|nr:hypothetical protein [Clostridiales bacterium]